MSGKEEKLDIAQLRQRNEAEVRSLLTSKADELRKARFKHALGQLRETHVLKALRKDIAKLNTALAQRNAQVEERT